MKRVFISAGVLAMVLTTSCQKDYYLEDLNDANAQIEQLESIVQGLKNDINDLNNAIEKDGQKIDDLITQLTIAQANLDSANEFNSALTKSLNETLAKVEAMNAEKNAMTLELTQLNDELLSSDNANNELIEQINELEDSIEDLEFELANVEPEVITVVETVTQFVDRIVEVAAPAESVANEMVVVENVVLTPMPTPDNRSGSWFTITGTDNIIQRYERNVNGTTHVRWVAFTPEIEAIAGYDYTLETAVALARG